MRGSDSPLRWRCAQLTKCAVKQRALRANATTSSRLRACDGCRRRADMGGVLSGRSEAMRAADPPSRSTRCRSCCSVEAMRRMAMR